MERALLVYTNYPSIVEAERAGRSIVERRLAACVNILPGMISHYWWQGTLERGEEAVMIIKTRASLADRVCAAVKAGHPYHARDPGAAGRADRFSLPGVADGGDRGGGRENGLNRRPARARRRCALCPPMSPPFPGFESDRKFGLILSCRPKVGVSKVLRDGAARLLRMRLFRVHTNPKF
jgi:periplasmic divalent cation tolerance protein